MPISDVQHQERAQRIVRRALAAERFPHAYIFHGPDGVGKELFAHELARVLLCEQPGPAGGLLAGLEPEGPPELDACGQCRACHLVDVDNHPDLHLIHRQLNAHHPDQLVRNRKAIDIGVDVIRHFVINAVAITPAMGRAKVFIIRDADRITPQAQNALLKTLEEPPPTTFLILLANSVEQLLSTTRSRCQVVGFSPLPTAFVAEQVQARMDGLSDEDAQLYAALAQGSLGTALQYAGDDLAAFNRELGPVLAGLDARTAVAAARRIQEFAKESSTRYRQRDADLSDTAAQRQALRVVFVLLATWYRDVLHRQAGTSELLADRGSAGAEMTLETAARAVARVAQAEWQLDASVNVQLCIESLMFELAQARQAAVV